MVGAGNPNGSRMLPIMGGIVIVAVGVAFLLAGIVLLVLQYRDYAMYAFIIGLLSIAVGIGLDWWKNGH
jgi:hypothetical protein